MPWFKVSDDLHSHWKAMAAGPAALGLWTLAGSWSSGAHTGGFVPSEMVPRLCTDGESLARKLVAAQLWVRVRGGYRFHEWDERNPTEQDAKALKEKRSLASRFGNHQRWHVAANVHNEGCDWCNGAPAP